MLRVYVGWFGPSLSILKDITKASMSDWAERLNAWKDWQLIHTMRASILGDVGQSSSSEKINHHSKSETPNCTVSCWLKAPYFLIAASSLSLGSPTMSQSTLSMAVAAAGLCALPAFIPGITGTRAPASSPALRGTAESNNGSTFSAASGAGIALTVLGAAAVKRVSARKAVRRELAVAYEDSGIDLLDNGKFAQGLVGASGGPLETSRDSNGQQGTAGNNGHVLLLLTCSCYSQGTSPHLLYSNILPG